MTGVGIAQSDPLDTRRRLRSGESCPTWPPSSVSSPLDGLPATLKILLENAPHHGAGGIVEPSREGYFCRPRLRQPVAQPCKGEAPVLTRRRSIFASLAISALVVGACSSGPATWTFAPAPSGTSPAATASATATATAASTDTPSPAPTPSELGFTPGTKAAPRIVEITSDDTLTFFPNVITAAEGETVTFKVSNTGKAAHEFMVGPLADALADKEGTPEIPEIAEGTTESITFTFDGPGPFGFACHAPGHFEVGMLGYFIVVGADVPEAGTKDNPRLVEVSMDDQLKFMPMQIPVTKGETVRFLLTNDGQATHEFAVGPKAKVDTDEVDGVIVVEADEITAHKLKVLDYTFDGPGPYGFACHEPGHFEAGMFGSIVLQ
jgi:uncharacterized cupredoxin-like copper-binding protein